MSDTGAPLHLEYLDPSQAQPEVILNANADKVNDFAAGRSSDSSDTGGGSISVSDGTHTVADCISLVFTEGLLTDEGGGVAHYTPPAGGSDSSDSGAALTVTDGTTTVHDVTEILLSGATVTNPGGGGTAEIAISGGGGGSSPYNVTPLTHSGAEAFASNDRFEETNGTGPDTTGSRFSGAQSWTWFNQNGAAATQEDGSLVVIPSSTSSDIEGLIQPVIGSTWAIQCQISAIGISGNEPGIVVHDSVSGKYIHLALNGNSQNFVLQGFTGSFGFGTNFAVGVGTWANKGADAMPGFFRITYDGTTLHFLYSYTGLPGTFADIGTSVNPTTTFFMGPPTDFGIAWRNGGGLIIAYDQFVQTA